MMNIHLPRAAPVDVATSKQILRNHGSLTHHHPISFVREPLSAALERYMAMTPDAIVYASRASRPHVIQDLVEIGVPFRQYDTNFLGYATSRSIARTLQLDSPAVFVASATTKTGSADNIYHIRAAVESCGIAHSSIHLVMDEVYGLLPFTEKDIALDIVDSFSCSTESFGISSSIGILAGLDVPDDDTIPQRVTDAIIHADVESVSAAALRLTVSIFEIFFSRDIPSYILNGSTVIMVKAPDSIRETYGLDVHDDWTCIRIFPDTDAGALTTIVNEIVYYHETSR